MQTGVHLDFELAMRECQYGITPPLHIYPMCDRDINAKVTHAVFVD
jgi:hypothetical protein